MAGSLFLLVCFAALTGAIPCPQRSRVAVPIVEAPAGIFSGATPRYRHDVDTYLGIRMPSLPWGVCGLQLRGNWTDWTVCLIHL